jgi:RNA polymerase sigma factor (sigma-70 family)
VTLTELYEKDRQKLVFKVYPYLNKSYDAAEDLVQTAFVKALSCINQYNSDKGSIKTWFNKILFSTLWNSLRKNKKEPVMFDIDEQFVETFLSYESENEMLPLIMGVENKTHKSVLLGHFIFGYTPKEIHSVTGVTQDNVRKIVQRFRGELK